MHTQSTLSLLLLSALVVLVSACQVSIDRNTDSSLNIETTLPESTIQNQIKTALADPLIQQVNVELQQGYILASATRKRLRGDATDTLTFRLDLGVQDGHLTATISQAEIDGRPIEASRVALWNERLTNGLTRAGQRQNNSTLQAVTVTDQGLTMTWRVETARSRGE